MVRLFGVPRSLGQWVRKWWREPWTDTLWKGFVITLIFVLAFFFAAFGGLLTGFVAFILISVIFSDRIQQLVGDWFDRDWASVDLSRLWPF